MQVDSKHFIFMGITPLNYNFFYFDMLVTVIPDSPTGYTTKTGFMLYITVTIASPSQP